MAETASRDRAGIGGLQAFLVVVWLALTAGGFAALYYSVYIRTSDTQALLDILRFAAWPLVVLALGVPAFVLLVSYMDKLWALRNSIEKAPEKIGEALDRLGKFKEDAEEISANLINRLNETSETLQAKTETAAGQPGDVTDTARTAILDFAESARPKFYELISEWNADGRRSQSLLQVRPGGGNRAEIAKTLRDARKLANDEEVNRIAGEFLETVYVEEQASRKRPVDGGVLARLAHLKQELEKRRWFEVRA
ncbi:MAG: hypothetical protein ABL932_10345 [Terricaulis sp.]